jgi:hypothetical protein
MSSRDEPTEDDEDRPHVRFTRLPASKTPDEPRDAWYPGQPWHTSLVQVVSGPK